MISASSSSYARSAFLQLAVTISAKKPSAPVVARCISSPFAGWSSSGPAGQGLRDPAGPLCCLRRLSNWDGRCCFRHDAEARDLYPRPKSARTTTRDHYRAAGDKRDNPDADLAAGSCCRTAIVPLRRIIAAARIDVAAWLRSLLPNRNRRIARDPRLRLGNTSTVRLRATIRSLPGTGSASAAEGELQSQLAGFSRARPEGLYGRRSRIS